MRKHLVRHSFTALLALTAALSITVLSHAENSGAKSAPPATISPDMVCMVNDTVMDRKQIPVKVDGRTYYGCCNGCVAAIKNDPSVRFAKDPVTGRKVDKSKAVIISGPRGTALYFESMKTAEKYLASIKK